VVEKRGGSADHTLPIASVLKKKYHSVRLNILATPNKYELKTYLAVLYFESTKLNYILRVLKYPF